MIDEFEVGDVVQLKTGGSEMAVLIIRGDEAICAISTGRGLERRKVNLTLLRKVDKRSSHGLQWWDDLQGVEQR